MTRESKTTNILKVLENHFPKSAAAALKVPVFFTDCFDLGKPYDSTREELTKLSELAHKNEAYDVERMRKCLCLQWREEKERILKVYEEMKSDEVIEVLG